MSIVEDHATLISDFAEFLTTRPAPDEILAWRPSPEAQDRLSDLLSGQNAGKIEHHEVQELDNCLQAELMLRLLKAKIQVARAK